MSAYTDAELLALAASPVAKAGPGTPGAWRHCAVRNKAVHSRLTPPTSNGSGTYIARISLKIGNNAITSGKFNWPNFVHNSAVSGAQQNTGNTLVIEKAALEYNGAYIPILFSAAAGITLADGDYQIYNDVISNASLVSTFGKSTFAPGDEPWLRIRLHTQSSLTTDNLPTGRAVSTEPAGTQAMFVATADTAEIYGTGAIVPSGGFHNLQYMYAPPFFGTVVTDNFAPACVGDSIAEGTGISNTVTAGAFRIGQTYTILVPGSTDFTTIGSANSTIGTVFVATGAGTGTGTATINDGGGSYSFMQRGMLDGSSNPYAYMEIACSGAGSNDFLGANTKWLEYLQFTRSVILELAENDAQTLAGLGLTMGMVSLLRTTYGLKVIRCAGLPRSATGATSAKFFDMVLQDARRNRRVDYWADCNTARLSALESDCLTGNYNLTLDVPSTFMTDSQHFNDLGATAVGAAIQPDFPIIAADFT